MGKFTPGPWTYRKNPMRDDGWFAYGPLNETLSFAQISEADARLIAAAPELLELTREYTIGFDCDIRDGVHPENCLPCRAKSLIAKVEAQ